MTTAARLIHHGSDLGPRAGLARQLPPDRLIGESLPSLFHRACADRLVILDEVQRMPGLFPVLRGLIDQARRDGRRTGLYLLLGSASLELLRQAGETLAGRTSHLELPPFSVLEPPSDRPADRLWVRGGFPESYLAVSDAMSRRWRDDFVCTYLSLIHI